MSFAVLSADAITARMLSLEAKRCGFCEESALQARVLLIDLVHPVKCPVRSDAPMKIAFCEAPSHLDMTKKSQYHAVLALPFCATELSALLRGKLSALVFPKETFSSSFGKSPHFSQVEQALLIRLQENRDRVVTVEELSTIIGQSAENSNAVAVYLYRLRRKLEADGQRRIRTVRGVGYRWLGD